MANVTLLKDWYSDHAIVVAYPKIRDKVGIKDFVISF